MRLGQSTALALVALMVAAGGASAAEPVKPDLVPEAPAVLDYLESVYGTRTLSGVSGTKNAEKIHGICGEYRAVVAIDICVNACHGWPPYAESAYLEAFRIAERAALVAATLAAGATADMAGEPKAVRVYMTGNRLADNVKYEGFQSGKLPSGLARVATVGWPLG